RPFHRLAAQRDAGRGSARGRASQDQRGHRHSGRIDMGAGQAKRIRLRQWPGTAFVARASEIGILAGMNKHAPTEVMMTEKLVLTGLSKRYGNHLAVDGLELRIRQGDFVSFLGPSGSGKTTVLNMIAGLTE